MDGGDPDRCGYREKDPPRLSSDSDLPSVEERPDPPSAHHRRLVDADVHRMSVQARSDWLRLNTLRNIGGIWLDATCILAVVCCVPPHAVVLYRPIDAWMNLRTDAVVTGYAYPFGKKARILESWALFVPTGSPFLSLWFEEFDRAVGMGFEAYIHDIERQGKLPPPGLNLPYHTIHVCGWTQRVVLCGHRACCHPVTMQRHPEWQYDVRNPVPLATAAACGWPWLNWSHCVQAFVNGTTLREDCEHTFTKLNTSVALEYQKMWLQGGLPSIRCVIVIITHCQEWGHCETAAAVSGGGEELEPHKRNPCGAGALRCLARDGLQQIKRRIILIGS